VTELAWRRRRDELCRRRDTGTSLLGFPVKLRFVQLIHSEGWERRESGLPRNPATGLTHALLQAREEIQNAGERRRSGRGTAKPDIE
jgi:hypothetical protein